MKRPKTIVGKRLQFLKKEYAMSTRQMAEDINSNHQAVYNWMTKYIFPRSDTIIKICKAYDVSADWLLGLTDERK